MKFLVIVKFHHWADKEIKDIEFTANKTLMIERLRGLTNRYGYNIEEIKVTPLSDSDYKYMYEELNI